ncbi:MAG: DNA translocase FtsK 4TM domain-containing protein [Candidatus Promineifilaceae bacterium]|nr:DNA translocase FtsK 4TM domain-containing protein [Candidatus Promineifilaceae bacterium]
MTRKSTSRKRTRRRRSGKRPRINISLTREQKLLLTGIVIIFVTAIIILSLLSPGQGQLTTWLFDLFWRVFGWGSYFVPVLTGSVGLYLVLLGMDQPPNLPVYRLLGAGLLFLVFLAFASMIALIRAEGSLDYWQVAEEGTGGGYLGSTIASSLTELVGQLGAIFVLMVIGFTGAILVSGISREDLSGYLKSAFTHEPAGGSTQPASRRIRLNPGRKPASEPVQLTLMPGETEQEQQEEAPKRRTRKAAAKKKQAARTTKREPAHVASTPPAGNGQTGYTWTLPAISDILESGSDLDLNNAAIREQVEIIEHTLESFGAPSTVVEINQGPTVTQFGVEPNYITMRNGRRTKVKVGKISGLADDLALALAARSIRIQAPVPGKSYVGIEVPNSSKSLVSLRDVMEADEYRKIKSPLGLGLGQNVSGQPIVADLTIMPHLLIAGTTGAGKSVCVNGIITCLLLQNTPDDLKLVMIDPKRVELTGYNGIPHLAAPVVVEMDRVISTLQWALREMDIRYKQFAEIGARHIVEYNKKLTRRKNSQKLPYIVIIVDELADLMMLAPEDTERAITRLAQLARATGIHLVIATQRPSVDVVTGLIKANFPARIAFAVASSTDSRVILDSSGAERLLGQGDMLFQKPDAPAPLRLQGCYVSDGELHKLISYWQYARRSATISADAATPRQPTSPPAASAQTRSAGAGSPPTLVPTPLSDTAPPQPQEGGEKQTNAKTTKKSATRKKKEPPQQQPLWEALQEEAEKPQYADELMPEAIALVRKLDKASTSLLQRRFRIGYTRAARMIDAMEEMKIIGPPTGTSKAREVLPPSESESMPPAAGSENNEKEKD